MYTFACLHFPLHWSQFCYVLLWYAFVMSCYVMRLCLTMLYFYYLAMVCVFVYVFLWYAFVMSSYGMLLLCLPMVCFCYVLLRYAFAMLCFCYVLLCYAFMSCYVIFCNVLHWLGIHEVTQPAGGRLAGTLCCQAANVFRNHIFFSFCVWSVWC